MSTYNNILVEINDRIAFVTINRPTKLNALNKETVFELYKAFFELELNNDVRVIILTGSGEKAFAAGADISEIHSLNVTEGYEFAKNGQHVFSFIERLKKPVIAAVNGYALGGGAELAWACHLRIASKRAVFGQPEINLGLIPGYGGTQRLVRFLPKNLAIEYLLTGENLSAELAEKFGLVNLVVEPENLKESVLQLAQKIAAKPKIAVEFILQAASGVFDKPLSEGLLLEAGLFGLCFGTEDSKEGTKAFLEKRPPEFKNQ